MQPFTVRHKCHKTNNLHLSQKNQHCYPVTSYAGSNMQGCTKCILLFLLSSLFLYILHNTGILKLATKKTINTMTSDNISGSNKREQNNKRRHTRNKIAKLKNNVMKSQSSSERSQVKVLLLAYGRTGSSLTGDLISADTTSAYFFEPFWWVWFFLSNSGRFYKISWDTLQEYIISVKC